MISGEAGALLRRESLCRIRSEEHTSELQSQSNLVCRLLLEKKKKILKREPLHGRDTLLIYLKPANNKLTFRNFIDRFIHKASRSTWIYESHHAFADLDLHLR